MKSIILLIVAILILSGCATDKNLLNNTELFDWSNRNDTIFYKNAPVAVFDHFEIELYRGRTDKEMCLNALNIDTVNLQDEIIRYVHTKHPFDKVQFTPVYHYKK